ncbi:MAG: tetratricopeptide repeat protein [Myxococcota bacterium]
MGYWMYYLAFAALYWVVEHPLVLIPIALFVIFRRVIPDPWVFARTFTHRKRLRDQIRANPANVTARRDLASIYLERSRAKKALTVLAPALEREPENAELLYLQGVARLRSGDADGALEPLVKAANVDPGIRFGDTYRVAGDALMKLKRHEQAIDAYEHFTDQNSSSIEGWVKLSLAHRSSGEEKPAEKALGEARRTWSVLPGYKRRLEWRWRVRAAFASLGL